MLRKRVDEFLSSEKSGDGKDAGKTFKENLTKFISDIVFEEVKLVKDSIPMKETLPEADASVMKEFKHDVGDEVFYVIFKQVRFQAKGKLQVTFGWQFTVLKGKAEEIQIRADHGVLYKVNGDWILQDLVFSDEATAVVRCNELNFGTDSFAITGVNKGEAPIEKCYVCGEDVDLSWDWCEAGLSYPGDQEAFVLCKSCWEKEQSLNVRTSSTENEETLKGGSVDGEQEQDGNICNGVEIKEVDGEEPSDVGCAQVGVTSEGISDGAGEGAL